jgi:non-reducing end alpha-L-arabinofuranosidase
LQVGVFPSMSAKYFSYRFLGVAVVSAFCWGCTVSAGNMTGSGGAPGSGGGTASGGSTGSGGGTASGGSTGSAGSGGCGDPVISSQATGPGTAAGSVQGPCDIYATDNGPCVAAHSTVRALYGAYSGPLYQVRKTDCTAKDIFPVSAGGLAKAADQDSFCGADACTISVIYDQSGKGNHLTRAPVSMRKPTPGNEANAKAVPITIGGQTVYGVHIVTGIGYRNNHAVGTATGDNPETEYMVASATVYNSACCFDYGNMETTSRDDGEGTMEAVYFGNCIVWNKGAGSGPWVMGDLENGLWAGNAAEYAGNMTIPSSYAYVTGMVKGGPAGANKWTIKEGNAQMGNLITPYDGARPSSLYNPMRKEGAIGLGTGGDGTNGNKGDWFEGVMTAAYSTDAAENAVQMNIVSVYGH